ncbi:MAG: STAUR_1299 family protein [Thermodesulfobacteriota bacterium]
MKDLWEVLRGKAFKVIDGRDYNRFRAGLPEARGHPARFFYEAALPAVPEPELFLERIYPALARFIQHKRLNPTGRGLTVALFHQDRCYLLDGRVFLNTCREAEGPPPPALPPAA